MNLIDRQSSEAEKRESPRLLVAGVGGSPGKGGNSDIFLKEILKGVAEQKVKSRAIHLR